MAKRRTSPSVTLAAVAVFSATISPAVVAQTTLGVEVGGSRIGPPVGMEGDDARFLVAAVRASHFGLTGSGAFGSVAYGRTLDSPGAGSFLSGMIEGRLAREWGTAVTGAVEARIMGYGVREPFPYRAYALEAGPALTVRGPRAGLEISGLGGVGRSRLELWRREDGLHRVFLDDLWRLGGTAELTLGPLTHNLRFVGGFHRTAGGDYISAGSRLLLVGRWGIAELRLDRWDTPDGIDVTGGLSIAIPIGARWSLRGFFGRTDPDPLTLAQPSSGSGGMMLGRDLVARDPYPSTPTAAEAPWEIVEAGAAASRVMITLPGEAEDRVQVLGDFTLWEATPMRWEGNRWVIELTVPVGTHHFGFLVNDEWYVPDDAPDVAPDEWGRLTATLVIEGA